MSNKKLEVTKVGTKLGKRTKYTVEEKYRSAQIAQREFL